MCIFITFKYYCDTLAPIVLMKSFFCRLDLKIRKEIILETHIIKQRFIVAVKRVKLIFPISNERIILYNI